MRLTGVTGNDGNSPLHSKLLTLFRNSVPNSAKKLAFILSEMSNTTEPMFCNEDS